ncbi:hypothetical protein QUV83_08685 [Cellulomonas cellasea]|uniref:hypothetical protein n=1 Tax=Cellulomonas cellasea TaxID=43670 RepID=UPI0025A3B268|nr:hypothetical protein [Cellulomonas cellasea]MDM8084837.1 hypothetical protein [Cellulomonas cellasea]
MTTPTSGHVRGAVIAAATLAVALLAAGCAPDDAVEVGAGPSPAPTSTESVNTEPASPETTSPETTSPAQEAAPLPTTIAESWAQDDTADTLVLRAEQPGKLLVTTFGSSTCPELPIAATWDERRTTLQITAAYDPGAEPRPCTRDLAPTTSVVPIEGLPDYQFTATVNGEAVTVPEVG